MADPIDDSSLQKSISLQQISAALAAKLTNESRTYTDELKEHAGIKSKLKETDRAVLDLARKITYSAQENNTILRRTGSLLTQIGKDEKYLADTEREIGVILGKNYEIRNEILDQANKLRVVYDNISQVEEDIQRLTIKSLTAQGAAKQTYADQLKIRQNQLLTLQQEKKALDQNSSSDAKRVALLRSSKKIVQDIIEGRKEELKFGHNVNKTLGLSGAILDNLDKIGVRVFNGFGINFGAFSESIREGKDRMLDVAEAFTRVDSLVANQAEKQKEILDQYKGFADATTAIESEYNSLNTTIDKISGDIKNSLAIIDVANVIFGGTGTKAKIKEFEQLFVNFSNDQIRQFALTFTEIEGILDQTANLFAAGAPISDELMQSYDKALESLARQSVERDRFLLIEQEIAKLQEQAPLPGSATQKRINDLMDEREGIIERSLNLGVSINKSDVQNMLVQGSKLKTLESQRSTLQSINAQLFDTAKSLAQTTRYGEEFEALLKQENDLAEEQNRLQVEFNNLESLGNFITQEQLQLKNDISQRLGVIQTELEDNLVAQEKIANSIIQSSTNLSSFTQKWLTLKSALGDIKKGLKEALLDPLTPAAVGMKLVLAGIDAMKRGFVELDKASTEFTRLNGTLANNNILLSDFSLEMASTSDVLKVASEMTRQLGVNVGVAFSPQLLTSAAALQNTMGLTAQEAGNLALISQATNTSINSNVDSVVKGVNEFNKMNKSAVSHGVIMKDVANVSSDIAASLGSNPESIAKAASAARRLGLDLKTLDSIANSLLDFESSIEAELEAQLLTGKNINLAKARELALNNDLAGLGKELFNNSADLFEFGQMNRLQQESYAKSLGMTRDQLAKVAYMRAIESGLTGKQLEMVTGMTAEELKRMEVSESINKSIEKISQALATPLSILAGLVSQSWILYGILGLISVILLKIAATSFGGLIKSIITLASSLGVTALSAMSAASALTLGLGAIAIIAGIAAMVAMFNKSKEEAASIPAAAEGAVVNPTKGGVPVIVGEGGETEYIIPKSKLSSVKSLPAQINADIVESKSPETSLMTKPEQVTQTLPQVSSTTIIQSSEPVNTQQQIDMLAKLIETNTQQLEFMKKLTSTMEKPTVVKLDSTTVGMSMRQGYTSLG